MVCQRCGRDNPPESSYCQACGNMMGGDQFQQPGYPPPIPGCMPTAGYDLLNFAGIGPRFVAAVIDGVVIGIPIGIISTVLSAMMAVRVIHRTSRDTSFNPGTAADAAGTFFAGFGLIIIISLLLAWAYYAMMESSAWQGTFGKKMMGIQGD